MEAEELISILIHLSKIDEHFDQFEFAYILNVGRSIGVEDKVVESMIKSSEMTQVEMPKKEEDRMTVLYYLLFLMKIDNEITEEEMALIHHYGFKLGFNIAMIEDFIMIMEKYKHSNVPIAEMLEIIKRYQN